MTRDHSFTRSIHVLSGNRVIPDATDVVAVEGDKRLLLPNVRIVNHGDRTKR